MRIKNFKSNNVNLLRPDNCPNKLMTCIFQIAIQTKPIKIS